MSVWICKWRNWKYCKYSAKTYKVEAIGCEYNLDCEHKGVKHDCKVCAKVYEVIKDYKECDCPEALYATLRDACKILEAENV